MAAPVDPPLPSQFGPHRLEGSEPGGAPEMDPGGGNRNIGPSERFGKRFSRSGRMPFLHGHTMRKPFGQARSCSSSGEAIIMTLYHAIAINLAL